MIDNSLFNIDSPAYSNKYSYEDQLSGGPLIYIADEKTLSEIANLIIAKNGKLDHHMAIGQLNDGRSALAIYICVQVQVRDGESFVWRTKNTNIKFTYKNVIIRGIRPYVIDSQYHEQLKSVEIWDIVMSKLLNIQPIITLA